MRCFTLAATCQGSHRDVEAALEYLDFFDKKELLDSAGVISDDDGNAISLPSDGGLEFSDTEGESEAKLSDGKTLTTRVTMAIIMCAFLKVHVEEETLVQFGDEVGIENMEDESVEQEGPLGEGLGEAEVEHKVEEEALVAETLLTGTQGALATMMLSHSPGTLWILENVNHENLFCWENLMPISHDIVILKGHSTSCSEWNKFLKRFSWSTKECATEDQTLNHNLVNI